MILFKIVGTQEHTERGDSHSLIRALTPYPSPLPSSGSLRRHNWRGLGTKGRRPGCIGLLESRRATRSEAATIFTVQLSALHEPSRGVCGRMPVCTTWTSSVSVVVTLKSYHGSQNDVSPYSPISLDENSAMPTKPTSLAGIRVIQNAGHHSLWDANKTQC